MPTKLILFSGLPGTGKSTLAGRLARELQLPLLCIDDILGEVPQNPGIAFWDSKVTILLDLIETQLELGLSVIADSVFMNKDRYHARELARKYQARFLPIYIFMSDDRLWEQRVTARYNELNNNGVAGWERIQHQSRRFREWEPGTALFIDSVYPIEKNYADVLRFVTGNSITIKPLEDIQLTAGKYH